MNTATYWSNNGRYQALADALQKRIPAEGSVADAKKNPALEKFRKAVNCYYDLYNNGLCNRAAQFAKIFGIATSQYKYRESRYNYGYNFEFAQTMYDRTEEAMDAIILAAAAEQLTKE